MNNFLQTTGRTVESSVIFDMDYLTGKAWKQLF